ncbi:Dabb family protein [Fibrella arboris]|uniref:Dabb family protein n=1 Tax=Fibrella arboris TaxID=3242486 RepID=UPI00352193CB
MFIHSVYFWLAKPESDDDRAALKAGLESLRGVDAIHHIDIGVAAPTRRPVIDHTYDFALLMTFTDEASHDVYQVHPIHLAFVEHCKHLWSRVQIYDVATK